MTSRRTVYATQNFADNLDEIERFIETIIPNLQRFPGMGLDFLARRPGSAEALARLEVLRKRLGTGVEIREYITGDYLLLYAVRDDGIYLLSIKHHLQLSFDLKDHWD
jgi:hypothetical protein